MNQKKSKRNHRRTRAVTRSTRKRFTLGDVIEFKTANGWAYAQYVCKHTNAQAYGELLSVIDRTFDKQQTEAQELAALPVAYVCFCRPQPEIRNGKARIIGKAPIPPKYTRLPVFKWAYRNIISGRVIRWEIWDGKPNDRLCAY